MDYGEIYIRKMIIIDINISIGIYLAKKQKKKSDIRINLIKTPYPSILILEKKRGL